MTLNVSELLSKRQFLRNAVKALALAVAGERVPTSSAQARSSGASGHDRTSLLVHVERPLDAETPVEEFTSYLTSNRTFFVRSHFGPPQPELIDPALWRLRVNGLVDRPLELSLAELKRFSEVTVTAVVQCSGNGRANYRPRVPGVQWQRGAVGNAEWTGVRLTDVLERAGMKDRASMKDRAKHLHLKGADRPVLPTTPLFVRSIPLAKALQPDTILAYTMNGRPLPLLHGAPLRLITPGWMADSCVKWLTDLTVAEEEAEGYYMQTAYRYPNRPVKPDEPIPVGELKPVEDMVVKSLIAAPGDRSTVLRGHVMIQGVAWTGEGRVVKVEVSTDNGKSWETARFIGEDRPYAWRQWQHIWQPKEAGLKTILSRATDDRGEQQPVESRWNPGGFLWNGVDRVQVEVKEA